MLFMHTKFKLKDKKLYLTMVKVVIVEDHAEYGVMLHDIINTIEGFEVYKLYKTAEECLKDFTPGLCAIAVVDIRLPGISGIELIRRMKAVSNETNYLICSTHNDNDTIFEALKAGASGYILKDSTPQQIKNAVIELNNGGAPMSPFIARKIVNSYHEPVSTKEAVLSQRESEIIELVSKGISYQDIADKLFISPETVKKHIRNIYVKLEVKNKVNAINKFKKL
jgi:NarL family two-component system response regulator LiaR